MKFLFASDSFKGTLSSTEISDLLEISAFRHFPGCSCVKVPIADGGEGTVDAIMRAAGGTYRQVTVHGPLFEERISSYGIIDQKKVIIEMAAASGLPLVPDKLRDPMKTTTYGTGQLIRDALDLGFRHITVAIGGSATNDGGMGAMIALGARFLDADGRQLKGIGADLYHVSDIDLTHLHPAVKETEFTVMCDVNNPLTGSNGATYTFGSQKGANEVSLSLLETGMKNYAALIKRKFSIDVDSMPGAGAAGGLGAALTVFLNARLRSGIETVLDLIHFDDLLKDVDLVVTGEGRADWQSAFGKVMSGVGMRAKKNGIPAVGLCGSLGKGAIDIFDFGIGSLMTTVNAPMTLDFALDNAEALYYEAAVRMFRLIQVGMRIGSTQNYK